MEARDEARNAANYPSVHRTVPTAKNYLAQSVIRLRNQDIMSMLPCPVATPQNGLPFPPPKIQ